MKRALAGAGLILGSAALLRVLSPDTISVAAASRCLGAILGLAVVVYANDVPKALPPLSSLGGDAAIDQAVRRFVGWSLTLGGLGYMAASIAAPAAAATPLAMALLGVALMASVARVVMAIRGARA
jgi:hypothetical protein